MIAAATILTVATCREAEEPVAPSAPTRLVPIVAPNLSEGGNSGTVDVLVGAGDIASCTTDSDEATAKLLDGIAGTVFTLGDNAYDTGTDDEYANCYDPTWGRHKERTRPSAGDTDYATPFAQGYFNYFGQTGGFPGEGYYSYDLAGDWHVVVLNSNLSDPADLAAQLDWLKADLAASGKPCTVAYWHTPYFSSAAAPWADGKPLWEMLYAFGVEIILGADSKYYERFAAQAPDAAADPAHGIRQFVVGTGGASSTPAPSTRRANSEMLNSGTPGVLKLTLGAGTYEWEFVPVAGMTFTDSGSGTCHSEPPPKARPGGPYTGEVTVTFDGSASIDYQEDYPLSYSWDFGDGSPAGTGDKPTHTYAAAGTYTVTLVVTDAKGNVSAPATTTATITSPAPVVALDPASAPLGLAVAPNLTFSASSAGPWSYRVEWGDGTSSTGVASAPGAIPVNHVYPALGTYLAVATVTDVVGRSGSDPANMTVTSPAAGNVILAAGDIADCGALNRDELTARVLEQVVATVPTATVFTLGDNAYPDGSAADYANCYHPTWGRLKDRTWASLGNHEYDSLDPLGVPTAAASFDYFGSRAGKPGTHPSCIPVADPRPGVADGNRRTCEGYYSLDIGDWHIIVLNDNLGANVSSKDDGIGASSGQVAWLRNDLTASAKKCQIVIWHQPRFMSSDDGFNVRTTRKAIWDRLYAAGVEIALNAHQHFYERHLPMNPDGGRDDAKGVLQFMVGTGGESVKAVSTLAFLSPNSVTRSDAFGVLKLRLSANAYEWEFLPASGYSYADSGSGVCH